MTSPVSNTLSVETLLMLCAPVSVDSVRYKDSSLMYSINVALLAIVWRQESVMLMHPVSALMENAKDQISYQMTALESRVVWNAMKMDLEYVMEKASVCHH